MKELLENWNTFLTEDQETEDQEEVELFHVSSVSDIKVLDPAIAVKSPRTYSKQEYKTWDRPRVFYFTRWSQEDITIGRITGDPYRVKIRRNELYDIYNDPANLKEHSEEDIKEYKEIRRRKNPRMHDRYPVYNLFEMWATLAEKRYKAKGFIYPQGENEENQIVALWVPVPAEKLDRSFYDETED